MFYHTLILSELMGARLSDFGTGAYLWTLLPKRESERRSAGGLGGAPAPLVQNAQPKIPRHLIYHGYVMGARRSGSQGWGVLHIKHRQNHTE